MIAWGRMRDIQEQVANVPDKWLVAFATVHGSDIRKFGKSRNSTLLYRSAAVLAAVENGETYERKDPEADGDAGSGQKADGTTEAVA